MNVWCYQLGHLFETNADGTVSRCKFCNCTVEDITKEFLR